LPRIAGVDIPKEKRIEVALTYVYGVGRYSSSKILKKAEIDPNTKAKDLTDAEVSNLRDIIQAEFKFEGDLRKDISMNIKRLMDIGSYRGLRHRRGLPVNGQRTKTNCRTRKGPKKTVGAKRKS
jgi:small subunit ribosomal protein S13